MPFGLELDEWAILGLYFSEKAFDARWQLLEGLLPLALAIQGAPASPLEPVDLVSARPLGSAYLALANAE